MKYKSLLKGICPIAIGISLSIPTVAQHNTLDIGGLNSRFEKSIKERFSMKNGHFPLVLSAPSGAAKTTATRARLVSAHMMEYDGGSWVGGSDSIRFFWSGLRGGDFDYAGFMVMAQFGEIFAMDPPKHEFAMMIPLYRTMTLDSVHNYSWDNGDMSYSNLDLKSFATLDNGMLNVMTSKELSGGIWENSDRQILTWNNDKNLTATQSDSWDGAAWEPNYRSTLQYNAAKDFSEVLDESYDNGTSTWETQNRYTFNYTGSDLTSLTYQNWSTIQNAFVNQFRNVYGYDNNYWATMIEQNWESISTSWVNDYRGTFTRDANGRLEQRVFQSWNIINSQWENSSRAVYNYDANGDPENIVVSDWTGSSWDTDYRYLYSYSTSGNNRTTTITMQEWDDINNKWENDAQILFTYNQYDRITDISTKTWDVGGFWDVKQWDFNYIFKYETYEDNTTGGVEAVASLNALKVYPNPASGFIKIDAGTQDIASVRVSDMLGRTVLQAQPDVGTRQMQLPTGNLVPGIYSVQVVHGGITETKQVQVQ